MQDKNRINPLRLMQDVSCEPLMLCPSENPQASLDIFSQPHHHPFGSCIHRKAINKDKPSLSSGVLPSRQHSRVCRLPSTPPSSVYQVTQCTALTLLNLGCTRHSSSQLGSALIFTRFPGSRVLCAAIYPNEDELSHHQNPVYTPVPGG